MVPLAPYVDPDSQLLVSALDVTEAWQHVEGPHALPCLVHLTEKFRVKYLDDFAKRSDGEDYLSSSSSPSSEGASGVINGVVLYR